MTTGLTGLTGLTGHITGSFKHEGGKIHRRWTGNDEFALPRKRAPRRQMVGLKSVAFSNLANADPGNQRLRNNPTLHRIRPSTPTRRPRQNLQTPNGRQMALNLSSHKNFPKSSKERQWQIRHSTGTWNRHTAYDFTELVLSSHDITAIGLDDFIADILDMAGIEAIVALRQMRERFQNPEIDAEELILRIEKLGLNQTANLLSDYQELL